MPRAIFLRISNCEFLPELASVTERRFPPPWCVEELDTRVLFYQLVNYSALRHMQMREVSM